MEITLVTNREKGAAGKLPEKEIFAVFNEHKFIAVMKKSEEGDIIARPEFVFN